MRKELSMDIYRCFVRKKVIYLLLMGHLTRISRASGFDTCYIL